MEYWSLHTHTRESAKDALPSVARVVDRAAELNYPALAITDHGTISGAVEHYLECRKRGIEPLIGVEAYVAINRVGVARPNTMHACIVAYNEQGYRNLCKLTTRSNVNFKWKPIIDTADLAEAFENGELEGLLMTSGCWFGLVARLLREGDFDAVLNVIHALKHWFSGHFYIEIQNHQIFDADHDDELHSRLLHTIAVEHDIPTVLTQDSHYINREDQKLHDAFKQLVSWSNDPDDAVFPGDGYHMVDTEWMVDHHAPDIYERGMQGLQRILGVASLRIPELEEYNLRVPDTTVSGDADAELKALVELKLDDFIDDKLIPRSKRKDYQQRVDEEMDVLISSGFSGYIMLVRAVCEFMRSKDIRYRVRGSATGSLVCWLTGITGYDPLKWNLSFDRFLSRDRAKPPDVDLDVEHERRHEVIDWLRSKFYVCGIGTSLTYGVEEDRYGDSKGSLIVAFKMRQRNIGADPNAPISPKWLNLLERIANYNGSNPDGTPIDAPVKSVGQHPAGILVAPGAKILDEVPQRWVASSETMTSAYDMDDVEKLGLVKLDVLGLRTLTAVAIAEELAHVRCEDFPFTDRQTFASIASGNGVGLFQLEGWTASNGARRLRPSKISDVIAIMALFRPAAIKSKSTESLLERRAGNERIPERHKIIADHTADTYGVLVYQEQALNILKDIGLSVEETEKARKAIKASNANVGNAAKTLEGLMGHIEELARAKGMSGSDIDWLKNALHAYAGYSFNRAHATAYGILAYQTAYLRVHYPVAFWTGTLIASLGAPKNYRGEYPEENYLRAARADGIRIFAPHVNHSDVSYSTDGKSIYRGLQSIKGVGEIAAKELVDNAPYASLDDLARKVAPGRVSGVKDLGKGHSPAACSGVIKALDEAGALDKLGWETHVGPLDKAARNNLITVANSIVKAKSGSLASRKELGAVVDRLWQSEKFAAYPKPKRAEEVAKFFFLSLED